MFSAILTAFVNRIADRLTEAVLSEVMKQIRIAESYKAIDDETRELAQAMADAETREERYAILSRIKSRTPTL